ncbi:MAG: phospholipid carrier-dependent glycosyltransferase [Anaerolineales bacterium]|nr:phospholipid carrier-dependent glycosyltransferase [Anaerolineales bacterium]
MYQKVDNFFSRYEFLLPLIIFVLFLAASLPGIEWGAPALWNPDELVWRVNSALRSELIFDETEPDWNYPSLPKYIMYAIGSITFGMGKSDFAFVVASRIFSAFLGALSGVVIYYLTKMLGANKRISFLAGLFYIASGVAVANGRFAHNDLYLQLFSILCVFFAVKYQKTKQMTWLFASFFSVGLAASSKYTGGSLILLPAFIFIFEKWTDLRSNWFYVFRSLFAGAIVSYLGYSLGTPKALFAPIYYFSSVIPALQNYTQYGFNSGARIGLFGQWAVFESAVGIFCYYAFILAFLWFFMRLILWKKDEGKFEHIMPQGIGTLLLAVLIFDLPFMISINYIQRYFIPFVPFLAILAALFVDEILLFTTKKKLTFIQPLFVVILIAGFSYSALRLVSTALLFINDSRIPATEYIATIRGYQKSIEYTLYPPNLDKRRFERAHNYPIYFVKYPNDVVPTGGRYEYNQGEQGLLERDTDYFVIDSYTYQRFYVDSICETNPIECDFFKRLIAGEVESFRLIQKFEYNLPSYLPRVTVSAVNPDILIFERVR